MSRLRAWAPTVLDLVAPVAGYYLLRVLGVPQLVALIVGTAPTAAYALWSLVKTRRLDSIGLYTVVVLVLSTLVGFLTGSPRFVLAKDGVVSAVLALWMFVSLAQRRPLAYTLARAMFRRSWPENVDWDEIWDREKVFRRVWRVSTIVWGAGTLADGVLRVLMSYTLPVDLVPALSTPMYAATFIGLQAATGVYYHRKQVWRLVGVDGRPYTLAGAS